MRAVTFHPSAAAARSASTVNRCCDSAAGRTLRHPGGGDVHRCCPPDYHVVWPEVSCALVSVCCHQGEV